MELSVTQIKRNDLAAHAEDASSNSVQPAVFQPGAHEPPASREDPRPAPLVPANVDLRDFPYMPLDVVRLRDSRIASHNSGEGFRCAVILWCVSWHQTPAASLPNDDIMLAKYAGFGRALREWRKMRQQALYGWIQCCDGRLYHPTVAEKALEAWSERLKQRWKTELARIKKAAQRSDSKPNYPDFEEWRLNFELTGQEQWPAEAVPRTGVGDIDVCPQGQTPNVPRETASKGREGKPLKALLHTSARSDTSEGAGAALARALRLNGFPECSGHHPDLVALAEEGITEAEVIEAARAKPGKSIGWIAARVRGRRADALERKPEAGGAIASQVDPAARQLAEAQHEWDSAYLLIVNDFTHELIDEAKRDAKLRDLGKRPAAASEAAS